MLGQWGIPKGQQKKGQQQEKPRKINQGLANNVDSGINFEEMQRLADEYKKSEPLMESLANLNLDKLSETDLADLFDSLLEVSSPFSCAYLHVIVLT